MLKLAPGLHRTLTDGVVEVLKDKNIITVSDFLQTDSTRLKQFLNIELADLNSLKNDLWKLIDFSPITGLEHYDELVKQSKYIPTGIESLDKLLGGGFLGGNIYDICGLSASGKTQLYTTIAVNWAANLAHETFVVDTKGDFSGDRIYKILINRNDLSSDQRKRIMRNIKVEKCNSPFKLIELLRNLLDQVTSYPRLKLFVIDSLPTLWFIFHGNKRSLNQRSLAVLANLLRKLAVEHGIVVVTVNIETRTTIASRFGGHQSAIDDANQSEMDLMNRTESFSKMATSTATVPALGKYWKSICSFRVQIERQFDTTNAKSISTTTKQPNERTIRIIKSNQIQTDISCMVHITNNGIT